VFFQLAKWVADCAKEYKPRMETHAATMHSLLDAL